MAKSVRCVNTKNFWPKSYYARLLAVRRVTQENRGKKTAGVDGIKNLPQMQRFNLVDWLNKRHLKASPTRRVWIPKPGKDEKRPLGIPTIYDRAIQDLVKIGIEPEWEARFEPNSYGIFRRSTHDAIENIRIYATALIVVAISWKLQIFAPYIAVLRQSWRSIMSYT